MKTTLLLFAALFLFTACDPQGQDCTKQTVQSEDVDGGLTTTASCPPPTDDTGDEVVDLPGDGLPVDEEVPLIAGAFSASVKFSKFDSADMDKVQRALELIQKIVRTREFKNRVLNHSYNGVKQFADNNGLTNAQIYQKLLEGSEELLPGVDNQMDLELELYANYSTSTVGYTYANTLKIWMNRKFFDQYEIAEVARNIFHEWTHKLGFGHDSRATAKRPYSVPYGVGSIIEDLGFAL